MRKLVTTILALTLTAAPAAWAKKAPNLELKSLKGETTHLADLRGSIVVVNFWATWCGPCRQELPRLSALAKRYPNVRFVAVSVDDPKDHAKVEAFLAAHPLTFDVWTGADLDALEHVGLGNVLPGTLILDPQGEVITRIMGEAHEDDISAPLDWLAAGKSGPPPPPLTKRY